MTIAKKNKVNLTDNTRGNKWSNPEREKKLREYTAGWINYYRYADMKSLMVRARYKMLRALHPPE